MRLSNFRSTMIVTSLGLACLLSITLPSSCEAKTCAGDFPNAEAVLIDCSACTLATQGPCKIVDKEEPAEGQDPKDYVTEITVEEKPIPGKKLQVCWQVDGAPAQSKVRISANDGQSADLKKIFKRGDIVFESSEGAKESGKAKAKKFKKVKKNGMADWAYTIQIELESSKTCSVDPRVCIREQGGASCSQQ